MGQYQTFVVRFWAEDSAEMVRGHIQHVASGRGLYFRDVDRMLEFMNAHLAASVPLARDDGNQVLGDVDQPSLADNRDVPER
jgi:hypothetical protein